MAIRPGVVAMIRAESGAVDVRGPIIYTLNETLAMGARTRYVRLAGVGSGERVIRKWLR